MKKTLLVLLTVLLLIAPDRAFGAGFGLISSNSTGTASSGAAVTTTAISTTGASLLVAVFTNATSNGQVVFTDSASNTWTATTRRTAASNGAVQIFYVASPTTSGSHTINIPALAGNLASVTFMAFKTAAASPFDVENGNNSNVSASITPTTDGDLIVFGYVDSGSTSFGPNAQTTATAPIGGQAVIGGNRFAHYAGITWQGTAAAMTTQLNVSSGISPASTIVAFKPSTAGGGGETSYTFVR